MGVSFIWRYETQKLCKVRVASWSSAVLLDGDSLLDEVELEISCLRTPFDSSQAEAVEWHLILTYSLTNMYSSTEATSSSQLDDQ